MTIEYKIIAFISLWIIIMLFITDDADIEIFISLVFIGFLITKILTYRLITDTIKKKINFTILILFIIFIVFITRRIINIINIQ